MKQHNNRDYEDDVPHDKTSSLKKRESVATAYDYYLTGEIGEPHEYVDLCDVLRNALPEDEVTIRINSGGGLIATGNQIINAINDSEAYVRGYIESSCGSMATMIFLACHAWAVSENAEFFIHTSSGGLFGKESETYAQSMFVRKKTHKLITKTYSGFLSEAEIAKVLEGTDLYFDSEDILERLDRFVAFHRAKRAEQHRPKEQPASAIITEIPKSLC